MKAEALAVQEESQGQEPPMGWGLAPIAGGTALPEIELAAGRFSGRLVRKQ